MWERAPCGDDREVNNGFISTPCFFSHTVIIYGAFDIFCNKIMLISFNGNQKWNESGFRPPLCTYRLNWARRTSWGWWDDWDDTVLQTQDSKFEPCGLRPSTLPLGHRGSPQYYLSHVDGEETFLFLSNRLDREPNPELVKGVKGSGANHYPRAFALLTLVTRKKN